MAASSTSTTLRGSRSEPSRPSRGAAPVPRAKPAGQPGVATRRRTVLFFLACAVSMIPWTVGLAATLPQRYVVGTWTLTWTGFDVVLIGCFSVTAWALWKQRQIALPAAMVTSVLLMCDAWFDLLTAHRGGDLLVSSVTALFGEIPIAIVLAAISTRLLRATMRATGDSDANAQPRSLWRAPLIAVTTQPESTDLGWRIGPTHPLLTDTLDEDDGDVQCEDEGRANRAAR
jgi:hypothetical protein